MAVVAAASVDREELIIAEATRDALERSLGSARRVSCSSAIRSLPPGIATDGGGTRFSDGS